MINRIIQTIIENKDFLEKSLENSINANEISMFSRDLRKVFDEAGRKTLVGILETVDTILFENRRRKLEYETKDLRKRTLMTDYGNIEYTRRYYRNKQTKEYIYLTDDKMGIEKNERISKDVQSKIIEFAHDLSYSKTGKEVVENEIISPTTVMHKIRQEELKVETKKEKKQIKRLYIEADEDHVSERGNKIGMPKLIYVHEGNYTIGKRNKLKNVHYIGCLGKNSEELWLEVAEYIDKKYDMESIEKVYLKGCSAEGHISHVYSDRMSSRPRTWCDDGIDKMSRLRVFVSNGGKIYEELIKNKKINTKLKKYDKIIQRHIKQDVEETSHYAFSVVNTGMHSNIRKILSKIMYG